MKKKKKRAILLPGLLTLLLAAGARVPDALAYFTSYASAEGKVQVGLTFSETETGDDVSDWTKHISVTNTGTVPCYVRVKVLVCEKYGKYVSYSSRSEGSWSQKEDGYWYYGYILNPGETSSELLALLDRTALGQDTENGQELEFNVIVVQEHTTVLYDGQGNPYADWTMTQADRDAGEAAQSKKNADAGAEQSEENAVGGTDVGSGEEKGNTGEDGQ